MLCCFSGEGGQCHVEVCCSNDGCDVVCLMLFLMLFAVVLLNCSGKFCCHSAIILLVLLCYCCSAVLF